ncbi:MAG: hypothetical protein M1541_02505 [Acidobacteria bacterium]|nr:hypothetical protein [Acidobacteriota bacterium]
MDRKPRPATRTELVVHLVDGILAGIARFAGRHLTGPYFRLKIAAAATLLSLLTMFPMYAGITRYFQTLMGQALQRQVAHPFSPMPAELKTASGHSGWLMVCDRYSECRVVTTQRSSDFAGEASHVDKLELRLTRPVLGWLSGTGAWTVVVWNHLAGFGIFFLLAGAAAEALIDPAAAALFVLGLAPTFFGSWSFNDFLIGDGVSYFLMLLAVTLRSPWLAALSFLGAAFSDERCIIAVPLLLCYLAIRFQAPDEAAQRNRSCIALISASVAWLLLRFWLAHTLGLSAGTSDVMTKDILLFHLHESFPGPFMSVFKASWALPAFGFLGLAAARRWRTLSVPSASFAVAIAPALLVWDLPRSVAYGFVVVLISLYSLRGEKAASRKVLAAILVVNVLSCSPGESVLRALRWI